MRPLRLDVHNGAPVWGGAEIATARLVAGLARRGHDVVLHCNDPEVERRAAGLGAPTRRTHLGGDIALHHALRFAAILRRRRPDALLLGTFRKLWLGALAGRLAGVPRVVARIGLETDVPRNAKYRFVFRRWVDAVAFNADVMRHRFAAVLPDYPGALVTIYTGVPARPGAVQAGAGAALRRSLGIPADAPLVGSVGRLAPQKRYERLVDALDSLPGVHALILGEGPERTALEARARQRGVADRLHVPGRRDDVAPTLAALDVFVLCSDREGMSNAMLEAMAAGVPVVSTDVSGAREALSGGGGLAPHRESARGLPELGDVGDVGEGALPGIILGSPAELAGTLRALLADPERRASMARAGRRVVGERFGEERMLEAWERLLGGEP